MGVQQQAAAGQHGANGKPDDTQKPMKQYSYASSSLPFGQIVSLPSIRGPTYLTAQTLVQQVAFTLSDKIFTYSPDTFDLDVALREWHLDHEKNGFGYETGVSHMQTRTGAGSMALGYMFSPDFNLAKRHMPQAIVASTATLGHLTSTLSQLSLLYACANPLVAHIAATDYAASSSTGLITDYVAAQSITDELGLALLSSTSTYEVQHMSLLATLLAGIMPTVHIYDGINVGRETTRIVDALGQKELFAAYQNVARELFKPTYQHADDEGKIIHTLDAFNEELGTDYRLFEYYGHPEPESVLVVFGSVEASLASQLAFAMSKNGVKVGAINVRVYRPFVEDMFLEALPETVKHIAVLGQVKDHTMVAEDSQHSSLYSDVLAALSLSSSGAKIATYNDIKYARDEVWNPSKMLHILQEHLLPGQECKRHDIAPSEERPNLDLLGPSVRRYTFWDVDGSMSANAPIAVARLLSGDPKENVSVRKGHDNLVQGGAVRYDIRCSPGSIEAPYSIRAANIVFVGDEKLLESFDILSNVIAGGTIVLKLPGSKDQDMEKLAKRLPATFRSRLANTGAQLLVLDPQASPRIAENPELEVLLLQLVFFRLTRNDTWNPGFPKLAALNGDAETLKYLHAEVANVVRLIEAPEDWAASDEDSKLATTQPSDITFNSFTPFDREATEEPSTLTSWKAAAQGFAFKEALGTQTSLRPDLGIKTHVVTVKERRRLTPLDYDRNIFHIEFDLGDSGLKYAIGEALGIHAENDVDQVSTFIRWYGLDAAAIVSVPSRENPNVHENRTILQSLTQNLDIFGRPPKRFYESLAEYADDPAERKTLLALGGPEGAQEFKRRAEVDTITYADVLLDFPSAHPDFPSIVRMIAPLKRREYSIASSQHVTPNSVSLLIVTVNWVDPKGRDRFGLATHYLDSLELGSAVTVSVKPSVMKLPQSTTAPLILAGLGTGLAPFRAFVQERAYQMQQGLPIGPVLLYMGSRHQAQEYLYGEEWEAYRDAGIVTLLGTAFSRDQPQKIYIQDRMRESLKAIRKAYLQEGGSFYLCGPTWPVPDVTNVLEEAVEVEGRSNGEKKVDGRREIEKLKEEARYVLEVY